MMVAVNVLAYFYLHVCLPNDVLPLQTSRIFCMSTPSVYDERVVDVIQCGLWPVACVGSVHWL